MFLRTRIFHGVNAVYKIPPYHPTTSGFDASNTLSQIDSDNLRSWGFNIVRLGVMWPGMEPNERGSYNQTYIGELQKIVEYLQSNEIYVILDFHQDLWHRKFCGEGVPDYIYDMCKSEESADTKDFPLPAVNTSYPTDSDGNPTLDACLSQMFAVYYMTEEVGEAFQCLYDNKQNIWADFGNYWKQVALNFKNYDNVLGYELLNEPWAGDVYHSPKNFLPKYVEKKYLQPMYEYLHKEIRTVDNDKVIFFEGLTIDYWENGFTAGPGGESYNDRQALAYHIYCPTTSNDTDINFKHQLVCNVIDDYFFDRRVRDAQRLGVQMIMTEFGAAKDIKNDLGLLQRLCELTDKFQQSWMYWQFKYYQDITTCTPEGESLYDANGQVSQHKIEILSRTFPQAVAGSIVSYKYHILSKKFELDYVPISTESVKSLVPSNNNNGYKTWIYVNRDFIYPNGVNVKISNNASVDLNDYFQVNCPIKRSNQPERLEIQQLKALEFNNGTSISLNVELEACGKLPLKSCTCRF